MNITDNTIVSTLDEALENIARRSFYEAADVIPNDDGTYTIVDAPGMIDDGAAWTYAEGMELPTGAYDYSQVHEPSEFYDDARHIRYNVGGAVDRLAEGKAVHFQYVIATADPETPEDIADDLAGQYDGTVGWALVAFGI